MLPASFRADFSLENRPTSRLGSIVPALAAIVLAVVSTRGWELLSTGGAALLTSLGLVFTLGLMTGRTLGRRPPRGAQSARPVVPPRVSIPYAGYQPQEIRCNPFFELL